MPVAVVVLTNLPDSETAFNVARALLQERLAAGVTALTPASSLCRWRGQVAEAPNRGRAGAEGLKALATTVLLALAAGAATPLRAEPLLEPDQAFRPAVRLVAGEAAHLAITYEVARGYYLYRDRFRVASVPPLPLGEAELPEGEAIDDPFVGPTRIFRQGVTIRLPFTASARPGPYRIRVTAQGCAEARFCYRPFVQELAVTIPAP